MEFKISRLLLWVKMYSPDLKVKKRGHLWYQTDQFNSLDLGGYHMRVELGQEGGNGVYCVFMGAIVLP